MSTSFACFMASEPIAVYLQGTTSQATGFDESPYYVDVYAHMDCGMRQSQCPHAMHYKWEQIELAMLDTYALHDSTSWTPQWWLVSVPEHLQPFNPHTLN